VDIVIGTTNPAKLRQCELALRGSGSRVRSLLAVLPDAPEVAEDGWDAEENAARKASVYSRAAALPVLSLDYALTFDGLPAARQPGMNVRRIPGIRGRASDDELLDYYSTLFASYGGRIRGTWQAGAAVATPAGRLERTTITVARTFVAQPSATRVQGYPLASLQLAHGDTYISELSEEEEEQLWQRVLGKPLRDLVAEALGQPDR
jgi:inosine/xanthosine triphosphate pyrophosphatase family protein